MWAALGRLCAVGLALSCSLASAQGVLIFPDRPVPLPRPIPRPTPMATYALKELSVQAKLLDQVARVQVSQTFVNTGSTPLEAQFVFPLPYDGAIDSLTLLVDGKEYPAKLLSAKEARARYEAIVRSNKDPALLEYMGTGMFQTSVFPIPAGAERKVTLTYSQLLRRDHGLTDFLFPLSTAKYTAKPVEKVDLRLTIESTEDIKNIYSPTYPVSIQRSDARHAVVTWTKTNEVPGSDFRLFYDVGSTGLSARVISFRPRENDDGYFMLLASPPLQEAMGEPAPKTVLFVVDKSGSMSGPKIEQARNALKFVLNNLREGDLFNIVAYESGVETFRPELERFNNETRAAAQGYVDGLYSGGGTNIHEALKVGLGQLKDTGRPSYVLFLTDGMPTVGVTGEMPIVTATSQFNSVRARVLPFGVGYDVNSRLLDRLARANFGMTEYVRPDEDIEAHVARVYNRIAAPVMTDVNVKLDFDGVLPQDAPPVSRMYPQQVVDLFSGEQLVIVGRYRKPGAAKVVISGKLKGDAKSFDFPAEFTSHSTDSTYAFVEKLWATRRIGELIDQLDLNGKNDELVKELVDLSTRYGILTPYTSFLADETATPDLLTSNASTMEAEVRLHRLSEAGGRAGFAQRSEKARFQYSEQLAPNSPSGGAVVRDAETDRVLDTFSVRSAGKEALFARQLDRDGQKQKVLVTPETAPLDLVKDKDQIVDVDRYSEAYFTIIAANTSEENQMFVQQQPDEHLLIKLRGQTYLVK